MRRACCSSVPFALAVALVATGCLNARVPQPARMAPESSYTSTTPEAERRDRPVTDQDLMILDRADAILDIKVVLRVARQRVADRIARKGK